MIIEKNGRTFKLVKKFEHDENLRASFNALTKSTYGFDFESWYQNGHWTDKYLPYALAHEDQIVANISVNIMDFKIKDEISRYIQLGTVMTDQTYRGMGLSRLLMDIILKEWEDQCDLIYLFANDSVLDFYPKFGFEKRDEYHYYQHIDISTQNFDTDLVRKLDLQNINDQSLLFKIVMNNQLKLEFMEVSNPYLIMFYSLNFLSNCFYYIEELDAIIVAETHLDETLIYGVFSRKETHSHQLTQLFIKEKTHSKIIKFDFVPEDTSKYVLKLSKEEDSTLFIKKIRKDLPERVKFPTLTHA